MRNYAQMVVEGYRFGAPSEEAADIDAQVAERMRCRKCGGPMHYEGYHRSYGAYSEYIALAVCNHCRYTVSF
jgi:hypothetical protein